MTRDINTNQGPGPSPWTFCTSMNPGKEVRRESSTVCSPWKTILKWTLVGALLLSHVANVGCKRNVIVPGEEFILSEESIVQKKGLVATGDGSAAMDLAMHGLVAGAAHGKESPDYWIYKAEQLGDEEAIQWPRYADKTTLVEVDGVSVRIPKYKW